MAAAIPMLEKQNKQASEAVNKLLKKEPVVSFTAAGCSCCHVFRKTEVSSGSLIFFSDL